MISRKHDLHLAGCSADVRLEHGPGEAGRGNTAKVAAIVGRWKVVDVERPELRYGARLRRPESASGPQTGALAVVVALASGPAAELVRMKGEVRFPPVA